MAVVGDQGARRGTGADRDLRQGRERGQDQSGEYRIARALRDGGDGGIAHGFLALAPPAACERESTVEPPGQDGRNDQCQETRQQRTHAEPGRDGEKQDISGEPDAADCNEA